MKFIKDFATIYKRDLKSFGIIGLVFFVLGMIFPLIVHFVDAEAEFVPVGSIVVMFGYLTLQILVGGQSVAKHFNISVSLGSTRKRAIMMFGLFLLLSSFFAWIVVQVVFGLEGFLCRSIFKAAQEKEAFELIGLFVGKIWILLIFSVAWSFLLGALILRFGNKVYFIFYFTFMVLLQLPALLRQFLPEEKMDRFFAFLSDSLSNNSFLPAVFMFLLIFAVGGAGVQLLRKQRVTL